MRRIQTMFLRSLATKSEPPAFLAICFDEFFLAQCVMKVLLDCSRSVIGGVSRQSRY